jgi:hypothetical protein
MREHREHPKNDRGRVSIHSTVHLACPLCIAPRVSSFFKNRCSWCSWMKKRLCRSDFFANTARTPCEHRCSRVIHPDKEPQSISRTLVAGFRRAGLSSFCFSRAGRSRPKRRDVLNRRYSTAAAIATKLQYLTLRQWLLFTRPPSALEPWRVKFYVVHGGPFLAPFMGSA